MGERRKKKISGLSLEELYMKRKRKEGWREKHLLRQRRPKLGERWYSIRPLVEQLRRNHVACAAQHWKIWIIACLIVQSLV
ncbi:hypothetical protein VNO77_14057 [Canavalia gladiata]|uniref:Uncharacterized protein n=1 Tax=Canavalia gladiata TaxID=3824 RepID=A0AAN9LYG3_CANGL